MSGLVPGKGSAIAVGMRATRGEETRKTHAVAASNLFSVTADAGGRSNTCA